MSIIYNTLERLEKEGCPQTDFMDIAGSSQLKDRQRKFPVKTGVLVVIVVSAVAALTIFPGKETSQTQHHFPEVASEGASSGVLSPAVQPLPPATLIDRETTGSHTDQQVVEAVETMGIVGDATQLMPLEMEMEREMEREAKQYISASETLQSAVLDHQAIESEEPAAKTETVESAAEATSAVDAQPVTEFQPMPGEEIVSAPQAALPVPGPGSNGIAGSTVVPKRTVEPDLVEQVLEKARVDLSYGRYFQGLSVLQTLSPIPADRADFWFIKGSLHLGLGQLDMAEKAFESAQQLLPDQAQIAVQLAIINQEKGDHKQALRILSHTAESHPNFPEIFLNQGYSQQALGATTDAGRSFRVFMKMTEGRSVYADQREAVKQWLSQVSFRGE